jgi:hypothetical protein
MAHEIDPELIAEARKALDGYIQRQEKKGVTVVVEQPLYHEGLYNVRCILSLDGQRTRMYYRQSLGRWVKASG